MSYRRSGYEPDYASDDEELPTAPRRLRERRAQLLLGIATLAFFFAVGLRSATLVICVGWAMMGIQLMRGATAHPAVVFSDSEPYEYWTGMIVGFLLLVLATYFLVLR